MRRTAVTRTVRELVYAHAGKPAVCLGGGPSLPGELALCPARPGAVYISANDHGARLTECDYLVAHDNIEDRLRPFGKPIISRHQWGDYRVLEAPAHSTGVQTAWLARLMGCAPIYICGMDCFKPGATYYDKPNEKSGGFSQTVGAHVNRWVTALRRYPGDYRPMGGPLVDALGADCKIQGPAAREAILCEGAGMIVTIPRAFPWRVFEYPAGTYELPKKEAKRFMSQGLVNRANVRA